jgi:thioesterase domain-containing protein
MAAAYIEAIVTIQPEGPYRLGGFCGGSLIAYEMAQQLRRAGQSVDTLIMIEPMAGPIRSLRLIGATIRSVGTLIRLDPAKQLSLFLQFRYLSRILRRAEDENTAHVDKLMQHWDALHPRRFSFIPAVGALRQDWMALFVWAVSEYVPRPYPGRITYIFARDNPDRRYLWWGTPRADEKTVEIHLIPGTHATCRTQHLPGLASKIHELLCAAPQ